MDSIFIAGIIQGILLAILLLVRNRHYQPNQVLGVLMLTVSFHLFLVMSDDPDFFDLHPHFLRITWLIPTLYGPLIFLYTSMVIKKRQKFIPSDLLIFLPFILYFLILMPYLILPGSEKLRQINDMDQDSLYNDDFGLLNQFSNILHIVFIVLSLIIFHRNIEKWREKYSDPEFLRMSWLKGYLIFVLWVVIISVLVFYAKKLNLSPFDQIYPYHFLGVVILIYWIGYRALIHPVIFTSSMPEILHSSKIPENIKYETYVLEENKAGLIKTRIENAMTEARLFLNPDLSLSDLSEYLNESKHNISQVLNNHMNTSFYNLVNYHRVEEFKKRILDPDNIQYTWLGLGHKSGFRSKATFYAVFKKKTGMTPSEYYRTYKIPVDPAEKV